MFYGILVVLLPIFVVLAVCTSKTFIETDINTLCFGSSTTEIHLNEEENYINIYFNNDSISLQELYEQSELIIKGKVTTDRSVYLQAIKSQVDVIEVYKGDANLKDSMIYIYEPVTYREDFNEVYLLGGYTVMISENEYILFLKSLDTIPQYHYKNDEAITFIPVSTYFGKFNLNSREDLIVFDETQEPILYHNMYESDICTSEQERVDTYLRIKKQLVENKLEKYQ